MCGVFGACFIDVSDARIVAATESLRARGPDHGATWRDPHCVLSHRLLAIKDTSPGGQQPMVSADGLAVLSFNGEIYNHRDLRAKLCARGVVFRSMTDTEVIVEGYRAWGEDIVRRLEGMFAFALWDSERRRVILARDRAGEKPLFYAAHGDGWMFGSEIKALHAAGLRRSHHEAALPFLLTYGYVPAPDTMFESVRQLEPGEMIVLETQRAPRRVRYYRAPFHETGDASSHDAVRSVRRLLVDAVDKRLESRLGVGAFLSGGVDSTIIVGILTRILRRRVSTFTVGFAGAPAFDETRYARLAATEFGTDHHEIFIQPADVSSSLERLVTIHDGPFGDSSSVAMLEVARSARQHVPVVLSGDGGDELFCGYPRLVAADLTERRRMVMRVAGLFTRWLPASRDARSPAARLRRFVRVANMPLAQRLVQWNAYFGDGLEQLVGRSLDFEAPYRWSRSLLVADGDPLANVMQHNFETYLPGDLLPKIDRTSMACSLEVRTPYLDEKLVDYVARLPARVHRGGLRTKRVLRRAFADLVPAPISRRTKMGFGLPLATWFRGPLRAFLCDALLDPRSRLGDLLELGVVRRYVDEHLRARADHAHRLFLLLTLEAWLRS